MKASIPNLKRIVEAAGGTLEEDHGSLDTRTFQAVAPDGKRWRCQGTILLCILWAKRGSLESSRNFNLDAFRDTQQRLAHGLEPIPADEAEQYATD